MPGPQKPITDHHEHRKDRTHHAIRLLEEGAFYLAEVGDDLTDQGFQDTASAWKDAYMEISRIVERVRKLPR